MATTVEATAVRPFERAYPGLVHYNRMPEGGRFAAWEQPAALVDEVRAGLRSLR